MLSSTVGEKTVSGKNHTASGCQGSGLAVGRQSQDTAHNTFLRMFKK